MVVSRAHALLTVKNINSSSLMVIVGLSLFPINVVVEGFWVVVVGGIVVVRAGLVVVSVVSWF